MKLEFSDVLEAIKIHRNGSHWTALLDGDTVKLVRGTMAFAIRDARDAIIESGVDTFPLNPIQKAILLKDPTLDVAVRSTK